MGMFKLELVVMFIVCGGIIGDVVIVDFIILEKFDEMKGVFLGLFNNVVENVILI